MAEMMVGMKVSSLVVKMASMKAWKWETLMASLGYQLIFLKASQRLLDMD
jgi:hypothetical protein